jgi:hypothetical protein
MVSSQFLRFSNNAKQFSSNFEEGSSNRDIFHVCTIFTDLVLRIDGRNSMLKNSTRWDSSIE